MKNIIAIDPGKNGGIVVTYFERFVLAKKMPATDGDVVAFFRTWFSAQNPTVDHDYVVVIEKVGGYIGQKQPGSAMFKFGYGVGFLHGVAMALGFPVIEVRPQEWQKHFHLGTKSDMSTTEWKNKLKGEAQRRFPNETVTLNTADALLISEWYRETHGGGQ